MAPPEPTFSTRYRLAGKGDVPAMARIRTYDWGAEEYWLERIGGYLDRTIHPAEALMPRIAYIANANGMTVGFAAGHLTRRFGCQGELEWVNVLPDFRRHGIGLGLLVLMATWFASQQVARLCVDISPANADGRRFYDRHGAVPLQPNWLVWNDMATLLSPRRPR